MYSTFKQTGKTVFPIFNQERIYMQEFTKKEGLPIALKHWQDTVDYMLDGVDNSDKIYLMVDQAFVQAGTTHRRGGLHVDGYWNPGVSAHGGGHGSVPSRPRHGGHFPRHMGAGTDELIILASNVQACDGVIGGFDEIEWNGGDYSHLHYSDFEHHLLEPFRVYQANTGSFLHESLPVKQDCYRTVVRLNVKIH